VRLRARVKEEVGLAISVGVARTKFLAKVASAVSKPDGLLVVEPDREQEFLLPLPVERLWGVGAVTAEKLHRKAIVGATAQVAACLKELAKSLDLDELVVVTWTYDPAPRHRSYELLAQAFGLEKAEAR